MKTRIIKLAPGIERHRTQNLSTVVARLPEHRPQNIRVDAKVAFERHYPATLEMIREITEPGFLVVAVAPGAGLCARTWVRADVQPRALIVGRHSRCDLYLPGDSELSLRHLALIANRGEAGPTLRAFDLRTGGGLELEDGTLVGGLEAEGTVFFGAARYSFFCFPTPCRPAWAEDAAEAWAALPERELVSSPNSMRVREAAERRRQLAIAATMGAQGEGPAPPAGRSKVRALEGVLEFHDAAMRAPLQVMGVLGIEAPPPPARDLLEFELPEGDARGEDTNSGLVLAEPEATEQITVGREELERGVILGRYSRCDNTVELTERCLRLSRVHALLLAIGDEVWVVDTASTNGTWVGDKAVAIAKLGVEGQGLSIPGLGVVRWRAL